MKKIVFMVLMFLFSTSANAYVDWMTVELDSSVMWTNDTNYVSVFLYDENSSPIEDAEPIIKSTPSFPVNIEWFVSCSSAEGRELCWKMDNDLVWLRWAYVSTIKSKDIDEDVKLTVYSDSSDNAKVWPNMDLKIWEGKQLEEVETLAEVPKVGWDNINWTYLLFVLFAMISMFIWTKFYLNKDN